MSDSFSLEQKKKILAQKKARLQKYEALLKAQERKEQLSRKIKIGELAEKAGISKLDSPTILGAFLSLSEKMEDPKQKNEWLEKGLKLLNSELGKKNASTPVAVS